MNILTNNTKILIKNIEYKKKIFKISKNSYFKELQDNFLKYYKNYDNKKINIQIQKINPLEKENSYFIGKNIKKKLDKLYNYYLIKYDNIDLYLVSNKKLDSVKKSALNKLKIIISLKNLFNRKNTYQKIIIYDINEKKKLPKKNNHTIGPENCNSGFCNVLFSNKENGSIVLYRNEELIKVLIHESIHANFIDYNIIINQYKSNINNKICTKYNILLNEAFTETLACLINMIIVSHHTNIHIDKIFNNEVNFMINTFNKIMNYYEIKKMDDIIVTKGCRKYFKQSTNVFSYYILKTLNYILIDDFLKIVKKNSNKFFSIKNKIYNKEYVQFVFQNLYILDKYIKKKHINNRSLRLSLYEIEI